MSLQAAIVPMGLASVMQRVLILGATGVACTEAADDGKEPIQFVQAQDARTAACVDDMSWRDSNHPADGCVSWTGYNCSESFDPWPGPNDYYDPPAVVLEKCPKTCKVCLPIHFALLLPIKGSWDMGPRVAGAAELAVTRINADKTLLPGRVLEYSWADSGCSAKQGLAAMGELLAGESRIDAVIGPACSSACEVTSHLSGGQGIPQISWGCTSPTLSDKNEYQLVRASIATIMRAITVQGGWTVCSLCSLCALYV